jgi:alpha-beta hydrolase superfamily lysophospholipase
VGSILQAQDNLDDRFEVQVTLHIRLQRRNVQQFEKAHGHFVQTKNTNMHYLTWENASGIPLVWAHGSFTNAYELLPIADSLVKAGYFIIAIDYYGHGQTLIPRHEVSLYDVADDIAAC